jgi:NADPH:quinone reductase-like Zn-dependent oxidoreductase
MVKRLLKILAALVVVAAVALAIAMSHDSACPTGPVPALAAGVTPMKAAVHRCYGPPEVVTIEDVAKPTPADDEVLVKVHAAALNPLDWHYMRGEPYVMRLGAGFGRPKEPRLGVDFAGTVEAVGKDVTRFKPGEAVFGARNGALAEYVVVKADRNILPKPERLTFEQAAGVGVAAVTALQALRDRGQLKPGGKVLINGASGGVGTFAVQIAKAMGAEVTGVCSTRNVELVRSIGADHVIDYTQQDYTQGSERYDLVVDTVGNHSFGEIERVLQPTGRYIIVGGNSDNRWLAGLADVLAAKLQAAFAKPKAVFFMAELNPDDLAYLAGLMSAGQVTPIVDHVYPLEQTAEAIAYLEKGHARGKVIVVMQASDAN